MRPGVVLLAATLASGALAEELFIPAAMQRQGPDGQWWNTEVWVSNTTTTAAEYGFVFLPSGGAAHLDELQAEPPMVEIAPRATVFRNDLVPQGQSGALRLVVSPGVVVYSRIASAAGRASSAQGMAAMSRSGALRPGEVAYLVGLRRTPQYRTTLGMMNPTAESGSITVRVVSQRGETVHEVTYQLAGGAVLQLDEVLHGFGVVRGENLRAELTGTVPYFAYGSVIDARSGAPTLILPLR